MKREQIIKILNKYNKWQILSEQIADEILVLQPTDDDINEWALQKVIKDLQPKRYVNTASENSYKKGLIEGAKAMRDNEIKHIDNGKP